MDKEFVNIDSDLKDLIPGYLCKRRQDIVQIVDSLQDADFETIRRLAHRMKGSGGGYGFDEITAIGAAMEQAALLENADEILRQIKHLEDYMNRVEVRYV